MLKSITIAPNFFALVHFMLRSQRLLALPTTDPECLITNSDDLADVHVGSTVRTVFDTGVVTRTFEEW